MQRDARMRDHQYQCMRIKHNRDCEEEEMHRHFEARGDIERV